MLPRIIFDTSGINALADGGAASEPLMRGLACGFDVILTGMSIGELVSTPEEKRESLLSRFDWLLSSAKCIWEPQELIRLLVSTYLHNPSQFDWTTVDWRARVYEFAIPRRMFMDDPICKEQREQQMKLERGFEKYWKGLRPLLDAILVKEPAKRPKNYLDAVAIAERENGVLCGFGKALYGYISTTEPTEAEVKLFMALCPPFRAACYGLVLGWYNWSLRVNDSTPKAGRNDLMVATYLPYCDRFISNDWGQRKALREIAAAGSVTCNVLSLADFSQSFTPAA